MSAVKKATEFQTFNDGFLKVYAVDDKGDGEYKLTLKHGKLRYDERTVGIDRYYKAKQDNVEITKVLRIPRLRGISTQDVAVLENGEQYHIRRAVPPQNVTPPCWDLSLERVTHDYDAD